MLLQCRAPVLQHRPAQGGQHARGLAWRRSVKASAALDRYGFPSFSAPFFGDIDEDISALQQRVDRDIYDMMGDVRQMQRNMDAEMRSMERDINREAQRAVQGAGLQRMPSDVYIRRHQASGPGSLYSYQSIVELRSGAPTVTQPAAMFAPPLGLLAAVTLGAYAAMAAAFIRNYDLTTYKKGHQWQLVLLWPVLCLVSPSFRKQFFAVVRGRRPALTKDGDRPAEEQQNMGGTASPDRS